MASLESYSFGLEVFPIRQGKLGLTYQNLDAAHRRGEEQFQLYCTVVIQKDKVLKGEKSSFILNLPALQSSVA